MNRRTFLKAASASAVWSTLGSSQSQKPPNIILILADDLGYGDVGCYGSRIKTPNIDRLSREGVRFTDYYAASSVCTPSRAALMTGRYPVRSGLTGVLQAADTNGLPESETTVAQTLRSAGYRTAAVGKWHLGSMRQYLPTNRGFDEYLGIPYSSDMWPLPLMRNTEVLEETTRIDSLTVRYTDRAVDFINRAKEAPFFLYMAHTAPHLPLMASERFRGHSPLGPYGDVVEEMDWSVGEVLNALETHGVADNTLVMFTSDNGPWYQGSRGGLRGSKGETYEGGMRVPFIARLPGRIQPGTVSAGVASAMDILPTAARFANASLPGQMLDGLDIGPLLRGEREQLDRDPFLYFDDWNVQCARLGQWKLHVSRYSRRPWAPDSGARVNLPLPRAELYNLIDDPQENYDCAIDFPDVVADIQARMTNMLPSFPPGVMSIWQDTMRRRVENTPAGALPVERKP